MRDEATLWAGAEDQLAALQKLLAGRVGALRLETPDGERPCLRVSARSGRTEEIHAGCADGGWWFVWQDGKRLGAADDVSASADRVADALTRADLLALAERLPSSLRCRMVGTPPDSAGLRVIAGPHMATVVALSGNRFVAEIEPGASPEPIGWAQNPAEAARRVARMLGAQ